MSLLFSAALAAAEDPAAAPDPAAVFKVLEAAAQPGPEHQKLAPLAGDWKYTIKMWMDPSKPPMESTGTIERKWILGGRFLEERISGKSFDGKADFEGRGTLGFDKSQNKYTYGWMCTMSTASTTSTGTVDESGRTFTFNTEMYCPLREAKIQGRDVIRVLSSDKHIVETYQLEDGKEVKMMEFTAERQK